MPDDIQLLTALRDGDDHAFRQLFDTYSDKLYRLAVGLLQDEDEAEEVVQESFLRLFEHLDRFEGRSKLGTWLYRVAYNRSIDMLRRRRSTAVTVSEFDESAAMPIPALFIDWKNVPDRFLMLAEVKEKLEEAIAALPEKLRAIFILREIDELSTQESADILGIKTSAAKVRLHRARLLLREELALYFTELIDDKEMGGSHVHCKETR